MRSNLAERRAEDASMGGAVRELDPAGELSSSKVYPFEFSRVDLLYESYNGINVRLRCAPRHPPFLQKSFSL